MKTIQDDLSTSDLMRKMKMMNLIYATDYNIIKEKDRPRLLAEVLGLKCRETLNMEK